MAERRPVPTQEQFQRMLALVQSGTPERDAAQQCGMTLHQAKVWITKTFGPSPTSQALAQAKNEAIAMLRAGRKAGEVSRRLRLKAGTVAKWRERANA